MNWEVFFRSNVFHFSDAGSAYYEWVGMAKVKTKFVALSAWPSTVLSRVRVSLPRPLLVLNHTVGVKVEVRDVRR